MAGLGSANQSRWCWWRFVWRSCSFQHTRHIWFGQYISGGGLGSVCRHWQPCFPVPRSSLGIAVTNQIGSRCRPCLEGPCLGSMSVQKTMPGRKSALGEAVSKAWLWAHLKIWPRHLSVSRGSDGWGQLERGKVLPRLEVDERVVCGDPARHRDSWSCRSLKADGSWPNSNA